MFFKKALKTLAGVNNTELSVYLNCKAKAWYLWFPPMHSPDSAKDTKKAAATVASGRCLLRLRTTTPPLRALWRPGLRMSPKAGARNEALSAQLFLHTF